MIDTICPYTDVLTREPDISTCCYLPNIITFN